MRVLKKRGEVIHWAGVVHAFPVLRDGRPELSRSGDAEAGANRQGWQEFFTALEHQSLWVIVESLAGFEHRILERGKARAELPHDAFGPPLSQRVWHEVNLVNSHPPADQPEAKG